MRYYQIPMINKSTIHIWFITFCLLGITPIARAQSNMEFFFGQNKEAKIATIVRVINTDTLELDNGTTIKLIGLKGVKFKSRKERVKRNQKGFVMKNKVSAERPIEEEVFEQATTFLKGKKIRLEYDKQTTDDDFNTLAYVYLEENDTFINAKLLEWGFCSLSLRAPNMKHKDTLRAAYQKGRSEQKGIHSKF